MVNYGPGATRTGALDETPLPRQMIIPSGCQRFVETVGKLLATEKWYWTETHSLEERSPGTNPSRSLDYVVTAPGCCYMLGQRDGVQKRRVLTHRIIH